MLVSLVGCGLGRSRLPPRSGCWGVEHPQLLPRRAQPLHGDGVVLGVALPADEPTAQADGSHAGRAYARESVQDQLSGVREVTDQRFHERDRLLRCVLAVIEPRSVTVDGRRHRVDAGLAAAIPSLTPRWMGADDRFEPDSRPVARELWRTAELHPCSGAEVFQPGVFEVRRPSLGRLNVAEHQGPPPADARELHRDGRHRRVVDVFEPEFAPLADLVRRAAPVRDRQPAPRLRMDVLRVGRVMDADVDRSVGHGQHARDAVAEFQLPRHEAAPYRASANSRLCSAMCSARVSACRLSIASFNESRSR